MIRNALAAPAVYQFEIPNSWHSIASAPQFLYACRKAYRKIANMTDFYWLMAFVTALAVVIIIRGFWRADKVDSLEKPDNGRSKGGPKSKGKH